MRRFILLFFLPFLLYSQNNVSPEEIEQELRCAEAQYRKSKKMFNPWYTGPLVTRAASMMPPGYANIQPYLFVTGVYATFNANRHSVSLPDNLYTLRALTPMQIGITDTMDIV